MCTAGGEQGLGGLKQAALAQQEFIALVLVEMREQFAVLLTRFAPADDRRGHLVEPPLQVGAVAVGQRFAPTGTVDARREFDLDENSPPGLDRVADVKAALAAPVLA